MPSNLWDNARLFFGEGFPSGQREQTVNLSAPPSKVRILPPPPKSKESICGYRILVITLAFQANETSSILVTRSR